MYIQQEFGSSFPKVPLKILTQFLKGKTGKQCSGSQFSSWLHDFDYFFQPFGNDSFLYLYKQLVHLKHLNLALRIRPEKKDQ